ncbi:MAG: hypothetical protein U9Q07_12685, partial [Planctomycetota bacterium]|nr:hypothetical protein [Planctomycetota bacterium]
PVLTGGELALCGQESGGQHGLGESMARRKNRAYRANSPAQASTLRMFIKRLFKAFMVLR